MRFCDAEQPNAFSLRVADQVDALLVQRIWLTDARTLQLLMLVLVAAGAAVALAVAVAVAVAMAVVVAPPLICRS